MLDPSLYVKRLNELRAQVIELEKKGDPRTEEVRKRALHLLLTLYRNHHVYYSRSNETYVIYPHH